MPSIKYLMIIIIIISSCHINEPGRTRTTASFHDHILLIDSAHPFYPYVNSDLPFAIPKERVTIYGITVRYVPALFPQYYTILLNGKSWLSPEPGDSCPVVIDSASINWPQPPRQPRVYHF